MSQEWFLFWLLIIGLFLIFIAIRAASGMINRKIAWFINNWGGKKGIAAKLKGGISENISIKDIGGMILGGLVPDIQNFLREKIKGDIL